MNKQSWLILIVGLALIGGTAGFLTNRKAHQKLGTPGVQVVPAPIYDPEGKMVGTNSVDLPARVLDYESEVRPIDHLVLNWLPKDTTFGSRYYKASDGFETLMNVVLMGSDRTSIHKPQYCLTGSGWQVPTTEAVTIPITQPHPYELPVMKLTAVRQATLPSGGTAVQHGLYVYWFVADGQLTADHNQRMKWMAQSMLRTGVLQRWAYVTCFALCRGGDEAKTFERMKQFIAAAVPQFQLTAGEATLAQSSLK